MCMDVNIPVMDVDRCHLKNDISVRTMEFGINIGSECVFIPRNCEFKLKGVFSEKVGFDWIGKYAFCHLNIARKAMTDEKKFDQRTNYVVDGLNEKGLSIGGLYLPGYSNYPTIEKLQKHGVANKAISNVHFGAWVLSNFATVPDVVAAVRQKPTDDTNQNWNEDVFVFNPLIILNNKDKHGKSSEAGQPNDVKIYADFHFVIHDQDGRSAVLEWVDGKHVKVYQQDFVEEQVYKKDSGDIPYFPPKNEDTAKIAIPDLHRYVGVMTNAPTYDWHINNLKNYVYFTDRPHSDRMMNIGNYRAALNGIGLKGLPASGLPADRFIQAYVVANLSQPPHTTKEALILGQKIINRMDIPFGLMKDVVNPTSVDKDEILPTKNRGNSSLIEKSKEICLSKVKSGQSLGCDITQWAVLRDHKHTDYYFRSYGDLSLKVVNVKSLAEHHKHIFLTEECKLGDMQKMEEMHFSKVD